MGQNMLATGRFGLLAAFFLVSSSLVAFVEAKPECAADPQADPENDPCNSLRYIPSNKLTALALSHYLLVGVIHVFSTLKWGAVWMSALTIGCFTYALGIALRFGLHSNPDSLALYIVMDMFVSLSPCAFIAAQYVLLGRLAIHLKEERMLLISPRRLTRLFIASDITTLLIQGNGGSTAASAKSNIALQIGTWMFFAGLVLQLISFVTFFYVLLVFLYRVRTRSPTSWLRDAQMKKPWYQDWRYLALAFFISCIGIIVRSIFRVVQLSSGFDSAITRNEPLFYGLDCLALYVSIYVYIPFWPGRFIKNVREETQDHDVGESIALNERSNTGGEERSLS